MSDKQKKSRPFEPRVLSGMRPTGDLHLGHYFGVIDNWVKLQEQYPQYILVADWHALTTDYKAPENIRAARRSNVLDWLSCGVDPAKSTIYVQSDVKEAAELHLLFSMITPLGWLERNPTYKEQQEQLATALASPHAAPKDTTTLGFLAYPVLQGADIAMVRGSMVPVGEDQLPHLELNREMIRRFTHLYKKEIFPEPKPLLTEVPKLLGTDNRKMSKSYGNAIMLRDDAKQVEKRVKSMITDPAKVRLGDKGNPDICNVFSYQKLMTPRVGAQGLAVPEIEAGCRSGALSCGDCKTALAAKVNAFLEPMRNRRAELTKTPGIIDDILASGAAKARATAQDVLQETREAMKL